MNIHEKLKELESELHSIKAPVLTYFLGGLTRSRIESLFERYSLSPPEELINIYEWKNGVQYEDIPAGKLCFGVGGVFFPLVESLQIYETHKEEFPSYFPLFSDDGYWVNMDEASKEYGAVYIYCPSLQILTPRKAFDSLPRMIETITACFKENIFWYDAEDFFAEDTDLTFEILKKMNPNSEYWAV